MERKLANPTGHVPGHRQSHRRVAVRHKIKTTHWIDGPAAKRIFDVVVSLTLLVFFAPVFALISVAILLCRDGPVLYAHQRVGFGKAPFGCLKFRTMHKDADRLLQEHLESNPSVQLEWDRTRKLQNDPRVGRVGHLLRVSSLDELPQLINVLRGEMSLVGPRPVTADELSNYGADLASYSRSMPGITGLWQVSGRNNTTYAERVALDVSYCANRTMVGDIAILLRTVRVVLTGHGAY